MAIYWPRVALSDTPTRSVPILKETFTEWIHQTKNQLVQKSVRLPPRDGPAGGRLGGDVPGCILDPSADLSPKIFLRVPQDRVDRPKKFAGRKILAQCTRAAPSSQPFDFS